MNILYKSNELQHICSSLFIYTALGAAAGAEQEYNYQNDNKTPYIIFIKEVTETIHYNKLPSSIARIKPAYDFITRAFYHAKRC